MTVFFLATTLKTNVLDRYFSGEGVGTAIGDMVESSTADVVEPPPGDDL